MPTATATTRKRRTRKASATTVKQPKRSASKVTPVQSAPVEVKPEVKSVEKVRRNLTQLDGFELAILPLIYLEGFAKLAFKVS